MTTESKPTNHIILAYEPQTGLNGALENTLQNSVIINKASNKASNKAIPT